MAELVGEKVVDARGRRRSMLLVAIVLCVALFDPYTTAVGSYVAYATRYVLCAAFILLPLRRGGHWVDGTVARCAVVLCILFTISVVWAPQSTAAAGGALDLWTLTLVGLAAARNGFTWVVRSLVVAAHVLVLASVASIVIDPAGRAYDQYGSVALHGLLLNENEFGRLMVVCAVVILFAGAKFHRPSFVLTGSVALLCAAMSGSAQVIVVGTVSFGIGALFTLANRLRDSRRTLLWLTVFPAACALAFCVTHTGAILQYLGRDSSLTNRVPLWEAIIAAMDRHWLLGYGANSVWRDAGLQNRLGEQAGFLPAQAHNSFLEVTLQVGVVGGLLLCVLLLAAARSGLQTQNQDGTFMLALTACLTLYSLSASVFGQTPGDVYWMVLIATAVGLVRERQAAPSSELRSPDDAQHAAPQYGTSSTTLDRGFTVERARVRPVVGLSR